MIQQTAATTAASIGVSAPHDLFALTDEQILEIEPEVQRSSADVQPESKRDSSVAPLPRNGDPQAGSPDAAATSHQSPVTSHVSQEPPEWLAQRMKDPWNGEEARELWNGVQQAKQEAAAYRAAFATPEDARALKELYPGGVSEARAASERARLLDDFDRSYFGAAGKSAQEVSASRTQLAQRMLREDPAAFREMVFAGLRALEESGAQTESNVGSRFNATSANGEIGAAQTQSGLKSAPTNAQAQAETRTTEHNAHFAAYASFEKAANEELERTVGGAIERTLAQALPYSARMTETSGVGAQHAAPLQARLSQAIRQDVEAALKGDRQLSEQVAQILSGRRLDNETRAQVVRLIGERAQQLVPAAAKRVLNDWTQATLAAHRARADRADSASTRREVAPVSFESRRASLAEGSPSSVRDRGQDANRAASRSDSRRVDYRKLSDEQILEM
jgi:hypothetical protein